MSTTVPDKFSGGCVDAVVKSHGFRGRASRSETRTCMIGRVCCICVWLLSCRGSSISFQTMSVPVLWVCKREGVSGGKGVVWVRESTQRVRR